MQHWRYTPNQYKSSLFVSGDRILGDDAVNLAHTSNALSKCQDGFLVDFLYDVPFDTGGQRIHPAYPDACSIDAEPFLCSQTNTVQHAGQDEYT